MNNAIKFIATSRRPLIITEGATDWKHMKNAFRKLGLEMNFSFLEYGDTLGDSNLWKIIETHSITPRNNKLICIFDRDSPEYIAKMQDNGNTFKGFSENVYGFCIPVPPNRTKYKNISIEFYYTENDLALKNNGRRLLFNNEVDKVITESCARKGNAIKQYRFHAADKNNELEKRIYDENVDEIIDDSGKKVGMSKMKFAEAVLNGERDYANVDFTNFLAIYNIINEIIAAK